MLCEICSVYVWLSQVISVNSGLVRLCNIKAT
jgi:hypothetical protein